MQETFWVRVRLLGEFHPGLKFQSGLWNKSFEKQIVDYMERDSARGAIQPGLKILAQYAQTGLGFSSGQTGLKISKKSHVIETEFQPGLKKEREHVHWLCFCTSVNFLTEICVLRPGWNWACNHNNISAQWAEPNFSPGWNSPCNRALSGWKIGSQNLTKTYLNKSHCIS